MFTTFFESWDCLSLDFGGKGTAILGINKRINHKGRVDYPYCCMGKSTLSRNKGVS